MSARFVRREVQDLLVVEGEAIALLMNSRVARLSEIGTACYEFLERPSSVEELAGAIEQRFCAPPEGDTLAAVKVVLDGLVEAGLIEEVRAAELDDVPPG